MPCTFDHGVYLIPAHRPGAPESFAEFVSTEKFAEKKASNGRWKTGKTPATKSENDMETVSTREVFVLVGPPKNFIYLVANIWHANYLCQIERGVCFFVVSVFRLDDKYVCMVLCDDIKPLFRQRLGRWVRHAEDAQSLGSLGVSSYSMPKVQMSKINSLRLSWDSWLLRLRDGEHHLLEVSQSCFESSCFSQFRLLTFWYFLHIDTIRLCL